MDAFWYTGKENRNAPAVCQHPGAWPDLFGRFSVDSVPQRPAVAEKRCTKCGETKPLTEFYVKDKRTGRLFSWCKACHLRMAAARYVPAPPRVKPVVTEQECIGCGRVLSAKQFHIKNTRTGRRHARCKDCRVAEKAAYTNANRQAIKARDAAYREARRDEPTERQRAWREAHPERAAQIARKSKAVHKDTVNAATHRRRARIKGNGGTWTAAEWAAIKAQQDYRCLMCGRREPDIALTVDHIVPVSRGGRNVAANLQGLCKSCNSKKHRRVLDLRGEKGDV